MQAFKESKEGVILPIRVTPRSARDMVAGLEQGELWVRLSAPPVEGKANQALLKFLAKALGLAKGRLELVSGSKSRHKKILVRGFSSRQVAEKLGL